LSFLTVEVIEEEKARYKMLLNIFKNKSQKDEDKPHMIDGGVQKVSPKTIANFGEEEMRKLREISQLIPNK